jgi:tetratricopeptide (TPR) repeat protein
MGLKLTFVIRSLKRRPLMKILALALLFVATGFAQNDDCDSLDACEKIIQVNPGNSLAHYRIGEILLRERNFQKAANQFRSALSGNLNPKWTKVWSFLELGKIFDVTGQRDRAVNQYKMAQRTQDNTRAALEQAAKYLETPYKGD